MALKDLLLSCAEGVVTPCNPEKSAGVTEITLTEQRCNPCNPGNPENSAIGGEKEVPGDGQRQNRLTRPLLSEATRVTGVTTLKTNGKSCNPDQSLGVTEVTALKTKEKPDGGPPEVVEGDEAAHDLWLAGAPIAGLDRCRFCGERISWQTDGTAFADGNAAHNACYEAELRAGRRWW